MAKVIDGYWSDGESKSETADDSFAVAADWSDGESILLFVEAAVVGNPWYYYAQH